MPRLKPGSLIENNDGSTVILILKYDKPIEHQTNYDERYWSASIKGSDFDYIYFPGKWRIIWKPQ